MASYFLIAHSATTSPRSVTGDPRGDGRPPDAPALQLLCSGLGMASSLPSQLGLQLAQLSQN